MFMRWCLLLFVACLGGCCSTDYDVCDWGNSMGRSDALDDLEVYAEYGTSYRNSLDDLPSRWQDDELIECYMASYEETWVAIGGYFCD